MQPVPPGSRQPPGTPSPASTVWAITTYFNPLGYSSRRRNYLVFREMLPVPLIAVEYAVDGFELQAPDADVLVQLRGEDVLWQKERLFNIARRHLPPHCEQVVWIDCDLVIGGDDWPEQLKQALRTHPVVQPFRRLALLAQGVRPPPSRDEEIIDWRTSLAAWLRNGGDPDAVWGRWGSSLRWKYFHGGVWAARRDICDAFAFYDRMIVGGGDKVFTAALFGRHRELAPTFAFDDAFRRDYIQWADHLHGLVAGSVGHLDNTIHHLWHGAISNRGYDDRLAKLHNAGFRAMEDLALDPRTDCWRWASSKPELQAYVRGHFARRREDG